MAPHAACSVQSDRIPYHGRMAGPQPVSHEYSDSQRASRHATRPGSASGLRSPGFALLVLCHTRLCALRLGVLDNGMLASA